MYFGFLGGSALLHLLAAHPKVVAAFGIVATVAMVTTANGPQNYIGSGQEMRRIERSVVAQQLVADADIAGVNEVARRLAEESREEIEPMVRQVLSQCGQGCASLTPAIVMRDEALLRSALIVWELERRSPDVGVSGSQIAQLMSRSR